jgi:hypothetical protein
VTTRELCERAAGLIYPAVRDDLDGRPLYVLHIDELPAPYNEATVRGWARADDDLRFRELIDERIGWGGRGPCIVVSGDCMLSVCGVAVHEVAHGIERGWTYPDGEPINPSPPEQFIAWTDEQRAQVKGDLQRYSHGLAWHRALAHIVARVKWGRSLEEINGWIGAGVNYDYPEWGLIRGGFSEEFWTRQNEPIRQILASAPPESAVKLFEA